MKVIQQINTFKNTISKILNMVIKKGDLIAVNYEGRFEDGEVFDSSSREGHEHPLEFTAGIGQVVQGFDKAVLGMEKGQEKEFTLKPEEAYGEYNPQLQQKVRRDQLPNDQEPEVGMTIIAKTPDGSQFPIQITAVEKDEITLDMNHPLAGKTLIFKIKILDVNYEKGKYAHKH